MNKMLCRPLHRGISRRDTLAIQRLFSDGALGGYWPADPAYAYEDSAGTIPASRDGVVGLLTNAVTGYPNAIQATTANKPYLRRTPVSNKTWLDSNTTTGALTTTFASSLGSACTIATAGAEGVTILEGQTVETTYNITPFSIYNGDVLIINRALTAVEKALVTRVLQRNVPTLGSELLGNGGFDTDTLWTKGAGWSIADGVAQITNVLDASSLLLYPLNIVPSGAVVFIKCNMLINTGTIVVYVGDKYGVPTVGVSGFTLRHTQATATSFAFLALNGSSCSIDSASAKVIL